MRRLALIIALIAGSVAGLAATASGDDSHTYYVELDNAFGLVDGSEVKVAGVSAGAVSDFFINADKRAVAKIELSGPVAVLGEDTVCSTEPQSLIAEYFMDCTPKGPAIEEGTGTGQERAEDPDIPVEQTRQTVQQDLVLSALRLPFRERLTLLVNEFGTALAGNAENLNEAIRRGAPALTETRKVFDLLAQQNTIIRDLNSNSDRIIGRLADRRQDVVDFIEEANDTAVASAERRDDLSQNFALLDDFLAELQPTMVELNNLAVQGTPLAANLRRAAPGLNTLSRNLPDFNASATDSVVSLGKSSVVGERALKKGRDEINQLGDAARSSFSVADDLAKFLRDIDDPNRAVEADARANRDTGRKGETGYTGMEGLLNYLYYQTLAINQYDEIGHILHFSIFEVGTGPCSAYSGGEFDPDGAEGPQEPQPGVPNADASGATSSILAANRCVAWLGDSQPGISSPSNLPPYDPSVCPGGSSDESVCNPAGRSAASTFEQQQAAPEGGRTAPTEPPVPDEGTTGQPGDEPVVPGVEPPEVPGIPAPPSEGGGLPGDLGDVLGLNRKGVRRGATGDPAAAASANQDLLGYLFGN